MTTFNDPIFGSLDLSADDFWEGELTVEGVAIAVDLTIDDPELEPGQVKQALAVLGDARKLLHGARESLATLARAEGEDDPVKAYFEHHRAELPPAEFAAALGVAASEISEATMLERLVVQRIGVYPGGDEGTFVVDFSLAGGVTNYVLAVHCDEIGRGLSVAFDS